MGFKVGDELVVISDVSNFGDSLYHFLPISTRVKVVKVEQIGIPNHCKDIDGEGLRWIYDKDLSKPNFPAAKKLLKELKK